MPLSTGQAQAQIGRVRDSQIAVEVLHGNDGTNARDSQIAVEILRSGPDAFARDSQIAVEVLYTLPKKVYGQAQARIKATVSRPAQAAAALDTPIYIASTQNVNTNEGSTGPITVNKPTGTQDGDLLLAFYGSSYNFADASPPAGWDLLHYFYAGAGAKVEVFGKIASGEPSNYSWSSASATRFTVIIETYRPSRGSWTSPKDAVLQAHTIDADGGSSPTPAPTLWFPSAGVMGVTYATTMRGDGNYTAPSGWVMGIESIAVTGFDQQNRDIRAATAHRIISGTFPATSWTTTSARENVNSSLAIVNPGDTTFTFKQAVGDSLYPASINGFGSTTSATLRRSVLGDIGDLEVLVVAYSNTTNAVNTPTGYTLVANSGSQSGRRVTLFSRVLDGTEGSTVTLTWNVAGLDGQLYAYTFTSGQIIASGTTTDAVNDTSTTLATPSVPATTSPGALYFAAVELDHNDGQGTTGPSGYTQINQGRITGGGSSNTRSAVAFKHDTGPNNAASAYLHVTSNTYTGASGMFVVAQPRMLPNHYGSGQAQADILATSNQFAQALAHLDAPPVSTFDSAQAQAVVIYQLYQSAQAQAFLRNPRQHGLALSRITNARGFGWGQARAAISSRIKNQYAQAQAKITVTQGYGQAQANIFSNLFFGQAQGQIKFAYNVKHGNAQADILVITNQCAQAEAFITKTCQSGQAEGYIKTISAGYGQAQGFIGHFGVGQAQGYIDTVSYLVKFNGYILPGYAQSEAIVSELDLYTTNPVDIDSFVEYNGLKNKLISLTMKIQEPTYAACKLTFMKAGVMLRSSSTWQKLYLQNPDRYYLAITQDIRMEQEAIHRSLDYDVSWHARPWLYSDATYTVSGTGLISINRTLADGTWTPAQITLTGTDITVSGYTAAGDFTGFLTVSGAVANYSIFTENRLYGLFIGPGTTYIETDGATSCTITWQNRWNL